VADVNNDGASDLIVGNFGYNSQFKASPEEPVTLVYGDFDKNGSVDPILSYYIQHKAYPFPTRDELLDQIYPMRKKFTTYSAYSDAQLEDVLSAQQLASAQELKATELGTVVFLRKGDQFEKHVLPIEAQYAPVYGIETLDYDHDGNLDIVMVGNQSAIRVRLGMIDANYGQLFRGNGKGSFTYVPQYISGLSLVGDAKSVKRIKISGSDYLLVGINNMGIVAYKLIRK